MKACKIKRENGSSNHSKLPVFGECVQSHLGTDGNAALEEITCTYDAPELRNILEAPRMAVNNDANNTTRKPVNTILRLLILNVFSSYLFYITFLFFGFQFTQNIPTGINSAPTAFILYLLCILEVSNNESPRFAPDISVRCQRREHYL